MSKVLLDAKGQIIPFDGFRTKEAKKKKRALFKYPLLSTCINFLTGAVLLCGLLT